MVHAELHRAAQHADRAATIARSGVRRERLAPKPIRLAVKSPSVQVPDAAAVIVFDVIGGLCRTSSERPETTG